jgi:flagellar biogenesis protein FliO
MRSILVLAPEAGPISGPDLTRYVLVCSATIVALLVLAWVFRRTVAGQLKARAARRSLQVLDVLPLSGKQKLVVVRCYDRSFLLGLGDREVRSIAELDVELAPVPSEPTRSSSRSVLDAFGTILRGRLRETPVAAPTDPESREPQPASAREGVAG